MASALARRPVTVYAVTIIPVGSVIVSREPNGCTLAAAPTGAPLSAIAAATAAAQADMVTFLTVISRLAFRSAEPDWNFVRHRRYPIRPA